MSTFELTYAGIVLHSRRGVHWAATRWCWRVAKGDAGRRVQGGRSPSATPIHVFSNWPPSSPLSSGFRVWTTSRPMLPGEDTYDGCDCDGIEYLQW